MSSRYDHAVSQLLVGNKVKVHKANISGLRSTFYRVVTNAKNAGIDLGKKLQIRPCTEIDGMYVIEAIPVTALQFEVVAATPSSDTAGEQL